MENLSKDNRNAILEAMLNGSKVATTVTDPQQADNPIIYTNRTFESLTGYATEDIIGKNCRFLQGPGTDPKTIQQIRNSIAHKVQTTVTLKNYRKDGTAFWNRLNIEPLFVEGKLYFIGTQTEITNEVNQRLLLEEKEEEINQLLLPIIPIHPDLGAVALVGKMDEKRFSVLTAKLSEFVQETGTHHVIIDTTGIIWEVNFLYDKLLVIQDVLRLMGSRLYITGISSKTAVQIASERKTDQTLLTFSTIQQVIRQLNDREGVSLNNSLLNSQ